jgi:hypothetical protein
MTHNPSTQSGANTTTLRIAWAKEYFLEHALHLIAPVVRGNNEAPRVAQDLDGVSQDATSLFAMLLRCDEKHNLLAATCDDYPYQATEDELTILFRRFLAVSEDLCVLARRPHRQDHDIEHLPALEAVSAHTRRLVHDDQSLYETDTYRKVAKQAHLAYQNGPVEEWPV